MAGLCRRFNLRLGMADSPANINLTYDVLSDVPSVVGMAAEWNALLAQSRCNRAFSSAQWFLANCRVQDSAPHVFVARRNGAIAGILPLVLNKGAAGFPDDESDYNDLIAASNDTAAIKGLLELALSARNGYQRLVLSRLRDDSNCLRVMPSLKYRGTLARLYSKDSSCPYVSLVSGYDAYLLTRSTSFRTSLRQAQRYADRNNIYVSELQPDEFPASSLPDLFLSLHLERFAGQSSLETPRAQAFVREVVPSLFSEQRLRAFALFESEEIVGISLCMVGASSLCGWNGGFRAAADRWSPGKLLINAGIREASLSHLREYDFLRGHESYKSRWANQQRQIGQLEFEFVN
jgi:CelD/BcsL family acetyltransferase involved in cellulose biosynthesis